MRLYKSTVLLAFFLSGLHLFAQESQLPPFVSRLTAVSNDNGVLLTWQDSDETDGDYYIYSHSQEITESNLAEAELLSTVETGVQEYLDVPDSEGPHYYAVLASTETGEQYEFFVPYRNKTTRGVRYTPSEEAEVEIVDISDITAAINEEKVTLTFTATSGEDIVIYRSTEKLQSAADLVEAVLLETQTFSGTPFLDKPMAGIPYYYGVFYDSDLRTGGALFEEGENVLIVPIQIPLAKTSTITKIKPVTRVRPLPYLMLSSTIDTGERLKAGAYETPLKTTTLSEKTRESIDALLSDTDPPAYGAKQPVWFSDKNNGELEAILEKPFAEERWDDALSAIGSYTRTRRTEYEQQRANFYEGQCLYFLGKYEEAFMKFIFAEDAGYIEVQPWLDDIISLLASD